MIRITREYALLMGLGFRVQASTLSIFFEGLEAFAFLCHISRVPSLTPLELPGDSFCQTRKPYPSHFPEILSLRKGYIGIIGYIFGLYSGYRSMILGLYRD